MDVGEDSQAIKDNGAVMRTIAALYVDAKGPYPKMANVDCWDEARDARLYDGPHPVVAHPPCGAWGRLSAFAGKSMKHCGPVAVHQVRAFGGVLEHPSASKLWKACAMPKPGELPDSFGGVTIEVLQCEWGHQAAKATWIYAVGLHGSAGIAPYRGAKPTHLVSTSRGRSTLPEMRKSQRHITPPLFAEWLVSLARAVK
jgi:hypothetical protein